MESKYLVVGLGTGRSGTASLASLLDRQPGGLCFHEANPAGAVFAGNPQSHVNLVSEFRRILQGGPRAHLSIDYSRAHSVATYARLQEIPEVHLLGDIAFYYLSYVPELLGAVPECKFVCMKRDRGETIQSWIKKTTIKRWPSLWLADRIKSIVTRTPYHTAYNYWQLHDGVAWKHDPVWDSCFPKFSAATKPEAIGLYWDSYYTQAEAWEAQFPASFRIFDVDSLSDSEGQKRILSFIGVPHERMRVDEAVHLHRSD